MTLPALRGALVADDPELGPVRYCGRCEEWWPQDAEFWVIQVIPAGRIAWWRRGRPYVRRSSTTAYTCRACRRAQQATRSAQRRRAA